jgi:phytoene dehydrogenase-like protein
MTRSLGDHLDAWFEGAPLKGLLGFEGVIGNFADPYQAGTAYVLLHHAFGEVKGKAGAWGIARGGMGAISDSIAASRASTACRSRPTLRWPDPRRQQRARGVVTEDGREFHARTIAARTSATAADEAAGPRGPQRGPQRRIDAYRSHSATFRMNVALSELPRFSSLPPDEDFHFQGAIELCPSLATCSAPIARPGTRAGRATRSSPCRFPAPRTTRCTPPGGHVASLFCQHFQRELPGGKSWDDEKETAPMRSSMPSTRTRRTSARPSSPGRSSRRWISSAT